MDKVIGGSIALALIVIALLLMFLAWRARSRRAASISLWPTLAGSPVRTFEIFYVATTRGGAALERVSLPGFSYRSFGILETHVGGVQLTLTAGDALALPLDSLQGVRTAQVAIDKVVERDGLVALDWRSRDVGAGSIGLTTYVRLRNSAEQNDLVAASSALVPTTKEDVA